MSEWPLKNFEERTDYTIGAWLSRFHRHIRIQWVALFLLVAWICLLEWQLFQLQRHELETMETLRQVYVELAEIYRHPPR